MFADRHIHRSRRWRSDTTPVTVISGVTAIDIAPTDADIRWDVSPASTGQVEYGTTTAYGSTTSLEDSLLTEHFQHLTGLVADTTYHYRIIATNPSGSETSGDYTFATQPSTGSGAAYPSDVAMPAYLAQQSKSIPALAVASAYASPFETEVARVNNVAGQRHRYSSKAVWNSDMSLMILDYPPGGSGSQRALLAGDDFTVISASNSTYGDFTWANTQPSRAWGYSATSIYRLTVTTGISATAINMTGTYNRIAMSTGSITNDDRYLAFMWQKTSTSGPWGIGVFDCTTSTVAAERTLGTSATTSGAEIGNMDSCGMSQQGSYVHVNFEQQGTSSIQGHKMFPFSGGTIGAGVHLTTTVTHWDCGIDTSGQDVSVICSQNGTGGSNGGTLGMYRIDGSFRQVIYNWPNGHISCRNVRRPGWCVASTFNRTTTFPGRPEILAVKLDGGPGGVFTVNRFGQPHCTAAGDYPYGPQASVSPDGARVCFASDWDGASVYAYVAGMDAVL